MDLYDLSEELNVDIDDALEAIKAAPKRYLSMNPAMPLLEPKLSEWRKIIETVPKRSEENNEDVCDTEIGRGEGHAGSSRVTRETRRVSPVGRQYVVLTQSVMRKPVLKDFLKYFLYIKQRFNTPSKLVILRNSYDELKVAVQEDDSIAENLTLLKRMEENDLMVILKGDVAKEDSAIFKFISSPANVKKTILVVGRNASLSQKIRRHNKKIQNIKDNKIVYERDLNESGKLVALANYTPAFAAVDEHTVPAPYSASPNRLKGSIPSKPGDSINPQNQGKLGPCLNEGGAEGSIFFYGKSNGVVKCIKIFHAEHNTPLKINKLALMIKKYPELRRHNAQIMDRISWPEAFVYNECNEPVGYVMRCFRTQVPFSNYNYSSFPKLIPGLTKKHQVAMGKSFAEIVDFMHMHNVVLCDINRKNLMFDERQQAYLVDLDSAQVADENYYYPSNVGLPEYLSPEHVGRDDYSFMHKPADDVWIMQMLLFSMLTPMANPYATTKSMDTVEIVRKGYYPYQAGEHRAENIADERGGVWHKAISHLPAFLKMDFWESFHGDGKYFSENNRMTASDWLNDMLRYEADLPQMMKYDPNSGRFMPTEAKRSSHNPNAARNRNMDDFDALLAAVTGSNRNSSCSKNTPNNSGGNAGSGTSALADESKSWSDMM